MKFKYQLRGFAIGVIITAIIMTAAQRENQSNSIDGTGTTNESQTETGESFENIFDIEDEKENLGNAQRLEIDGDLLINNNNGDSLSSDLEVSEGVTNDNATHTEQTVETDQEEPLLENELLETDVVEVEEAQITRNHGNVTLAVVSGDSSYSVSRKLFELGVVDDVLGFDLFLCANGYDKKIRVGVYNIEPLISYEILARLISSQ